MILTKQNIAKIDIDSVINNRIVNNKLNEILFIVPTRRKLRYLTRELISIAPNNSAAGLKIETIGSYAKKLNSVFYEDENIISEESAVLILNQCFKETELKYFSQYRREIPFGTLERIKNVISEYKRHGISPDHLVEESKRLTGADVTKALDIANIYERFQAKLENISLCEIGDVYLDINNLNGDEFKNLFKENFPDVKVILINGFDEFTEPETEIINSTSEIKDTELFVVLDYYRYNPLIFSHLDACHDRFIGKGFKEIADLSTPSKSKFINTVRENFSKITTGQQDGNFKDKLNVISARSREKEIELVAKQIKLLLQNRNTEPNKICVVFNLIEKYSPIIRDRFSLFGIPFNLTDRFSLSTSEPIKGIIHLLEVAEDDFYYKNILRAFSNYFIQIEEVNLSNLLKVSVELKIVSGYANWISRITDKINELSSKYDENERREELIKNCLQAEKEIQKIKSMLVPFDKKLSPQQFLNEILSLIFGLNFPATILNGQNDVVEKDLKALNTFINSLREFTEILELESEKEIKYDLSFYLNQIRTLTAFSRYNVAEKSGYGVQITTLNEIRGLNFDYLFICGLNDGDFPTRFSPEIFFSGSFAREEERYQIEQRYLFYQALCSWRTELFLTYPLFEEKKELVQSSFLQDFLKIFSTQSKNEQSFSSTIFSKRELLEHIGFLQYEERKSINISEELNINLQKINHSIEIDKKRKEDPFGNFGYSGFIGENIPNILKDQLNEITDREFSATQLETYAKCPYKFFLENILRIQTVEEPLEELEAFEFGSLLHSILFIFYSSLKRTGIVLKNCSENDFKMAEKLLFDLAHKKFDDLNLTSESAFFEREKLLGINDKKKNSILYKFLLEERNRDDGYIPSFFELGFGKVKNESAKRIPVKKEIKISDVKLRGKIDRVDVNDSDKTLKVVDYKLSGTKPTIEDLKTGLSLQLPLYLYASKELISAYFKDDYKPAGAQIFSLKYSEKDFGIRLVNLYKKGKNDSLENKIENAEEMIKICKSMVSTYVKAISEGKFNLSLLDNRESKICRYCDFKKICRIQEIN
ncbi:MAG: exodeoxyribonuclease V subunit gamma [Ignavibacteria bacterium]|nr:exodeoxyribonuclease V subunit gamma [Ignavibacteria bacterium]